MVNVPLHTVRFREQTARRKVYDDGRIVDFYEAEPDQFVRAYADGRAVWAQVGGFSIHRGIRVVLVNLSSGAQIVTDHDPRAVFGVVPPFDAPGRFYPDQAEDLGVLVPCEVPDGVREWGDEQLSEPHESIWDALNRKSELLDRRGLGSRIRRDSGRDLWVLESRDLSPGDQTPPNPRLSDISWASITGVDYTGVRETGYDLTVPGYETFMSADGVILSNTMSIHVAATDDAVNDIRERLMPSRMLFSVKDREKTMGGPKHEQVLGLGMGDEPKSELRRFENEEQAMEAIRTGQVRLSDQIQIGDHEPTNG